MLCDTRQTNRLPSLGADRSAVGLDRNSPAGTSSSQRPAQRTLKVRMSSHAPPKTTKPVTLRTLAQMKKDGQRITMLTGYDATFARLLDNAGIDMILVGDSLGIGLTKSGRRRNRRLIGVETHPNIDLGRVVALKRR